MITLLENHEHDFFIQQTNSFVFLRNHQMELNQSKLYGDKMDKES
jgi:hypothetical protein